MPGYPEVFWLAMDLSGPTVTRPAARTRERLAALELERQVEAGQSVAVAVGSRGIADLAEVVRATVGHLHDLGLHPFVVPAMGSHGGATARGQVEVLAGYGVTEAGVGCPIRTGMEVVELARSDLGFPVWFDRSAAEADHVVLVNRVKPHTLFEGKVESGLLKMLLIGLGKREGASTYHRAVFDHDWSTIVERVAPLVLSRVGVLAGVAIVENAADQTARIEALAADAIGAEEPLLLAEARSMLPRLPFDDLDIVLIDEIGKDISGTGFDTNVVGRKGSVHEADPGQAPRVRTIVVRSLTPGTHGNGLGVGLAELCRTRVLEQMDTEATWVNALTCGDIPAGMAPIHRATDRELLDACSTRSGLRDLDGARLCWIRHTLDLGVLAASAPLLDAARANPQVQVLTEPRPLPFDLAGNLPDRLPDPEAVTG